MASRAAELARQFEAANNELIEFVNGLSDEEWGRVCPNEERTIAALTFHVAFGYPFEIRVFRGNHRGHAPSDSLPR